MCMHALIDPGDHTPMSWRVYACACAIIYIRGERHAPAHMHIEQDLVLSPFSHSLSRFHLWVHRCGYARVRVSRSRQVWLRVHTKPQAYPGPARRPIQRRTEARNPVLENPRPLLHTTPLRAPYPSTFTGPPEDANVHGIGHLTDTINMGAQTPKHQPSTRRSVAD